MPGFSTIQKQIDELEVSYFSKRQLFEMQSQRSKQVAKNKLASPWFLVAALGFGILVGKVGLAQITAQTAKTVTGPQGKNAIELGRLLIGPALAYIGKRSFEQNRQFNTR